MFKSLRTRLILVYSLIISITILAVDFLILNDYFQSRLQERTIAYFTYGNIAANIVSSNPSDVFNIARTLQQYTKTTGARFLFVDNRSVVVADGANRYTGEAITNPQLREALAGTNSWALYGDDTKSMQLAVPVISGDRDSPQINGAILIAAGLEDLYEAYYALRWRVSLISLLAGLSGILFSLAAAYHLSGPLNKLIAFSKRLSKGHLGEEINIRRTDEIGQLANTINTMSTELHRVEKNRRRFIGDVSHELKTPLASIKALAEALMMGHAQQNKQREFLGDIVNEVDRLSALIHRLLTLTRLEEASLNREHLLVSDIIKDTIRVITPLAASHGLDIIDKVHTGFRVPCDRNLVREMLVNILDNSIKYRDRTKEKNWIVLNDYLSHGKYRLEISDNGIGIADRDLPRVFEGFFRSEPSRSKEIEGYGMGLAIVKRIAVLHGWDITAESWPGKGTTVILTIPR